MKCAKDQGLCIPQDISLIGIDDILLARYEEPALTTVKVDKIAMGRLAMERLMDKMNGKEAFAVSIQMNDITERSTVLDLTGQ